MHEDKRACVPGVTELPGGKLWGDRDDRLYFMVVPMRMTASPGKLQDMAFRITPPYRFTGFPHTGEKSRPYIQKGLFRQTSGGEMYLKRGKYRQFVKI